MTGRSFAISPCGCVVGNRRRRSGNAVRPRPRGQQTFAGRGGVRSRLSVSDATGGTARDSQPVTGPCRETAGPIGDANRETRMGNADGVSRKLENPPAYGFSSTSFAGDRRTTPDISSACAPARHRTHVVRGSSKGFSSAPAPSKQDLNRTT